VVIFSLLAEIAARAVRIMIPANTHPGFMAVNLPHADRSLSLIFDSSHFIVESSLRFSIR
jgi:hypothetical protein